LAKVGSWLFVNPRFRTFRLLQLEGKLGQVAYEMTRIHFLGFQAAETCWCPAVNIFLCSRCVRICADLAGVNPAKIGLSVEDGKLWIHGSRLAPEPSSEPPSDVGRAKTVRVLAMEIDYGPFARAISLPDDADLERIRSHWDNGLLWIEIPRLSHA
jgi:HSP20 family molecular chaperone IbpA